MFVLIQDLFIRKLDNKYINCNLQSTFQLYEYYMFTALRRDLLQVRKCVCVCEPVFVFVCVLQASSQVIICFGKVYILSKSPMLLYHQVLILFVLVLQMARHLVPSWYLAQSIVITFNRNVYCFKILTNFQCACKKFARELCNNVYE